MNTLKTPKRRTAAIMASALAVVCMMAVPVFASAATRTAKVEVVSSGNDPTAAQYAPPIDFSGAGGTASSSGSSSSGSLPFTGLDVLALVGAALILTGSGLLIRRLSVPGGERRS